MIDMGKPDIQALLASGDATSTVIEMDNYVSRLCDYGERMEKLSPAQRVFYINQNLEREVNNGGFHQFFFNSSGDNAYETVDSLEAIGAFKTAELLRQAISKFPDGKAPADPDERQVLMVNTWPDGSSEVFGDFDERFFAYEDPLTDLNFAWIRSNAGEF